MIDLRAALWIIALGATGCAGTIVAPEQLPPAPHGKPPGSTRLVLLLSGVPAPMAEEVRDFARSVPGTAELALEPEENIRTACTGGPDIALRPRLGRIHFASNAPDRNTLFIYETAIIVGIPVALVSSVAWPYYAEMVMEGGLEVLHCGRGPPERYVDSFRLRSEGRGFVRTQTLREAQFAAAARGLVRELLGEAFP